MAVRKITLGRGLNALLGEQADISPKENTRDVEQLSVNKLVSGKYQPRMHMDKDSLSELAASIKSQGIIQPIIVRKLQNSQYEIIAGERRWTSAKLANLTKVPVIIKEIDDKGALAIALIENLQREDLNALEEARGLSRLIEEFSITHQQAADSVGKSRASVSNLIRLLSLEQSVQDLLGNGTIEMGHARALLALESKSQIKVAKEIAHQHLTVRQGEALIRKLNSPIATKTKIKKLSDEIIQLQQELSKAFDLPLVIKPTNTKKGKIVITYQSMSELNGIINSLK